MTTTTKILVAVGVIGGSILAYKYREQLIGAIKEIPEIIGELFIPTISDITRLRRWRIPLAEHGIYNIRDLVEVAEYYGLSYIRSFNGVGDIGIYEIRLFLRRQTGKWYPL